MKLNAIKYSRTEQGKSIWRIEGPKADGNSEMQWCSLGNINLIVGRNATGKTKTLNLIRMVSDLVSEEKELSELVNASGSFEFHFTNKSNDDIYYTLAFDNHKIIEERLCINDDVPLDRGVDGIGELLHVKRNEKMEFQAPDDKIVVATRRDPIQHPFFEELYQWGKTLRHYSFSGLLGRDSFVSDIDSDDKKINFKDPSEVISVFGKGEMQFGSAFVESVKADMKHIGYPLDEIGISATKGLFPHLRKEVFGMYVKEADLIHRTPQHEMSEGMFRSLSLIIHLNYALSAKVPSCILIDDIGEGLDYQRSTTLIELLIDKAKDSSVQLILATNNQFVMNKVDLEYWSVIKREMQKTVFYNYRNAKDVFDQFELTGLDNFDFFSSNYFLKL